ncbi:MAG: hypothetical protein V1897_08770 [Pseudomonadota bacterium]
MDNKILLKTFSKKVGMACGVFVVQLLLLGFMSEDNLYAQDWAINRSWNSTNSASATPVRNTPNVPSTLSIQLNTLLQQRSAIQQQVTVAQRCVKNNTLNEVLRDPEGNRRVVPSTDVINCLRTLNALNRLLVSNQQAINNLNQDAQFKALQANRLREQAALKKRLKIITGEQ